MYVRAIAQNVSQCDTFCGICDEECPAPCCRKGGCDGFQPVSIGICLDDGGGFSIRVQTGQCLPVTDNVCRVDCCDRACVHARGIGKFDEDVSRICSSLLANCLTFIPIGTIFATKRYQRCDLCHSIKAANGVCMCGGTKLPGMQLLNMMAQVVRAGEELWHNARRQFFSTYDQLRKTIEDLAARPKTAAPPTVEAPARRLNSARVSDGLRVYAIGDIHGRADLLEKLFVKIEADAASASPDDKIILVFLGDYVDRGFQSKEVIDFLLSDRVSKYETIFLKGNHEEAFLKFMSDPGFGPDWARYGGSETLTSYGIRPPRTRTVAEDWVQVCEQLNEAMPTPHRSFLTTLLPSATIDDYMFVHAGVRPGKPLDMQSERDLLWIRDSFLNDDSCFEHVIVHGHTPITDPFQDHRRIGIDTGAYLSGKLTAARFIGEEVVFLTT